MFSLYQDITNHIGTFTLGTQVDLSTIDFDTYDLLIIRRSYTLLIAGVHNDLMFVLRNMDNANIEDNKIKLKINHYKLK